MNFEDDNWNYLRRRGKRRRIGGSPSTSPETIAPAKPQHLQPPSPKKGIPPKGFKLSQSPFFQDVSYFGLVEIACQAGFIAAPPEGIGFDVEHFSKLPDFRQFASANGEPLLLPQLRDRIEGKFDPTAPPDDAAAIFIQFSESSLAIEEDKDVGALITDLHKQQVGPSSLDDVIAVFGDPNILLPCFTKHKDKSSFSDCVLGISKLRRFTGALDALLLGLSDQRAFARSLWAYHHFWLSNTPIRFDEVLERAGNELTRWVKPDPNITKPHAALIAGKNPLEASIASARRLLIGASFK